MAHVGCWAEQWLNTRCDPATAAQFQSAAAAYESQLQLLQYGTPCSGSGCACHGINSRVQQLAAATAAILQDPAHAPRPAVAATAEQNLQHRLHAQIEVQQMLGLSAQLAYGAQLLGRAGHNPEAECALADAFNRCQSQEPLCWWQQPAGLLAACVAAFGTL